jgi:hypothetical protein
MKVNKWSVSYDPMLRHVIVLFVGPSVTKSVTMSLAQALKLGNELTGILNATVQDSKPQSADGSR